ncbi:MAG: GntR family transcriptional regulator [Burkholderiaceae bacterium]
MPTTEAGSGPRVGGRRDPPRADIAHRRLREQIMENRWPPGHWALERDLCDMLGMSRTPVREAMVRLADEGLIEIVPRHGLRVQSLSATMMREVYQVLGALEAVAAEIVAADAARGPRLTELERATDEMAEALDRHDLQGWARADESFHEMLVGMCGNRPLIETVARFRDRVHRARLMTLRLRPVPVASTEEHRALVEAMRAGDPARAGALHRAHRARGAAELVPILESLDVV